jgi:hypothetical protein
MQAEPGSRNVTESSSVHQTQTVSASWLFVFGEHKAMPCRMT